ncbi:hypothetical protein BpHYR1_053304 [Brachionus plicatilis]|uniref:Uncharacterized protein n=1 Tax=Brachionus plicatilis TaxID=10195 RepID=A0A3M7T3T6_BRAPC|nr:hypothetical protein BpHYR1_053304 [Brachionus plicatilis]
MAFIPSVAVLSITSTPAPVYLNVYSFTVQYYALMRLASFKCNHTRSGHLLINLVFNFFLYYLCYNREPPDLNISGKNSNNLIEPELVKKMLQILKKNVRLLVIFNNTLNKRNQVQN